MSPTDRSRKDHDEISPTESDGSLPGVVQGKQHDFADDISAAEGGTSNDRIEPVEENPRRGRKGSGMSQESQSSRDSARTLADEEGHDAQVAARSRSHSRARSSVRSVRRDAIIVPRSQRRGFLAKLAIIGEVTDPYDYDNRHKWTITFIIALAAAAAPMGSAIILPALDQVVETFNARPTVVNLSVAMYMLSMAIFPLWWSSFSETLGRRTIYLTSFLLNVIFSILSAVSTNIAMFVVTRMLAGGAAASVQAVGAGTIADIWEVKERGRAMGFFYLGPLCGPLLAPIIGGALAQSLGWRSTQWALAIHGLIILILICFCLPETLRTRKPLAAEAEAQAEADVVADGEKSPTTSPNTLRPQLSRTTTTQSVAITSKKYLSMLRRALIDPLKIILYLRFPAVTISVAYAAITFGSLYVLNISIQRAFSRDPYNYSTEIVGLLYIPSSVGYFIASMFGGRWVDNIMHREARKAGRYDERGRLKFIPEDRMKENAWIGAMMYPSGLILYGWTARYGVNLAAPLVGNFFFGVGSMLIFALVTTMLTEFMPRKASHGIALNNFVRNVLSCLGTVVAEPLIGAIGDGWVFTGLGVICLASGALTIWAMKRFGDRWRVVMDQKMESAMGD